MGLAPPVRTSSAQGTDMPRLPLIRTKEVGWAGTLSLLGCNNDMVFWLGFDQLLSLQY